MPTPTFSLDFAKVDIGILVIDFQGKVFMNSDRFQNLQFKTSLNSLWPSISELQSQQNEQKRNGVTTSTPTQNPIFRRCDFNRIRRIRKCWTRTPLFKLFGFRTRI